MAAERCGAKISTLFILVFAMVRDLSDLKHYFFSSGAIADDIKKCCGASKTFLSSTRTYVIDTESILDRDLPPIGQWQCLESVSNRIARRECHP